MGLIAGLLLLVIGLSGSALVFRDELQLAATPQSLRVEPTGSRRSLDSLLAAVNQSLPDHDITGWLMRREPHIADLMYARKHGARDVSVLTVNPFNGQILGGPQDPGGTLTGWLLELHYTLFAGHFGVFVAGLMALLLCLLGLTGLWLYRDFWGRFFTLRWRSSARIFFSDIHKMVGISSVAFNLVLGFTGAWWNLSHALGHLVEGDHEDEPPPGRYRFSVHLSLDTLAARSGEILPGFRPGYVSLPDGPEPGIVFYGRVASRNPLRSDYGSSVTFDAQSGKAQSSNDIRTAGIWAQLSDMFYPLHFGNFAGLPVKILWCMGGMAPGVLAISGFVIWWKRGSRRRQDRTTPQRDRISSTEHTMIQQESDV